MSRLLAAARLHLVNPLVMLGIPWLVAGISFAILPEIMVSGSPQGSDSTAGYTTAFIAGAVILAVSALASLLIPKQTTAELNHALIAAE